MGVIKHVGEVRKRYAVGHTAKINEFLSTRKNPTAVRFSGHHLKWTWTLEGTTYRKPDKAIKLGKGTGWIRKIYYFKGATVIINPRILEVWLKSRPYKSVERMIAANWNRADLTARAFSLYAQIAIRSIKTEHPDNIVKAHLVMTTNTLNPVLKPMSEVNDEVGLKYDEIRKACEKDRSELQGDK